MHQLKKIICEDLLTSQSLTDKTYCSNCLEPQWSEIEILGRVRTVGRMCSCQAKEYQDKETEQAKAEVQRRLDTLKKYSLMEDKFYKCTFENFKQTEQNKKYYMLAKQYCVNWEQNKKENIGLMFVGTPGVGKSYLAYCIANELLSKGIKVMATSITQILSKIKTTFDSDEDETTIQNKFNLADLLIIDDLGTENKTDWSMTKLYEIIDSRYRLGKPIIVTTNYSPEQLQSRLTSSDGVERVMSRLEEMTISVSVVGANNRQDIARTKRQIFLEEYQNIIKGE